MPPSENQDIEAEELLAGSDETVETMAQKYADHYRRAHPIQKIVTNVAAIVGHPASVGVLTLLIFGWIGVNFYLEATGRQPFDPPPFYYLSAFASVCALYLTAMILSAQRHDDELSMRREQLSMHLAILSERKSAKIIQLLEGLRLNSPEQSDAEDHEAASMSRPVDPEALLDKIDATHRELR
jgi:uncharacterized membrane protein